MFDFFKRQNKYNLDITESDSDKYLIILSDIAHILVKSELNEQVKIINNLSDLLKQKEYSRFKQSINSIEMWGGAGAVWEVYIEDKDLARMFEKQMINLIDLMEKTKILGRGIKPIKKYLRKTCKTKLAHGVP